MNARTQDLILVTGAAGFIGYHLCEKLLQLGYAVIGLDNINDYYDVNLKHFRLKELGISIEEASIYSKFCTSKTYDNFKFIKLNIEDREELPKLFDAQNISLVCNLAAQAGVRYSIENPNVYVDSNVVGFLNILECCRHHKIKRLVYASSSSVYGNTDEIPFNETASVDKPISLYAATKKANELMAFTYSHLYKMEVIGLRFFTVYGPWGRPDMAPFLFTDAIINDNPINVFNNGNLSRDFTYIDDIIDGVIATLLRSTNNPSLYKLYNIGNGNPVKLMDFIECIEKYTEKKADKIMMDMQAGDVYQTYASTQKIEDDYGYAANTNINLGVERFVKWYKTFKKL